MLPSLASATRRRLAPQDGFTMITVMLAMMGILLLSAIAIATASNDLRGGSRDQATKQALAAAEAGLNDYGYHLNQDNNYWTKCDAVPTPALVSQPYASTALIPDGGTGGKWRPLPGTTSSYANELLPVGWTPTGAGATKKCDPNNAAASMLDSSTGTFRIRSTGRTPIGGGRFAYRSIVTSFRRKGFLDFLYFTDYETRDPAWYQLEEGGQASSPPIQQWASDNCVKYWRQGRASATYPGTIGGKTPNPAVKCGEIQFADNDKINGPFHTNDSILVCGTPDFGRSSTDKIEVEEPGQGWRDNCGGSAPNFKGTYRAGATHLNLPTSNSSIKANTASAYQFTGTTQIELKGNQMDVTNGGVTKTGVALPPNGVIYVADGDCGQLYNPLNAYGAPAGCGNVYVRGTYSKDLTIAAEGDVIIRGSITKTNDSVLGLIANQFVRIYHPVSGLNKTTGACTNNKSDPYYFTNIQIDAGILALQHSFTVDHYFCGDPLGTLTVNGVIAQKFRGPVGTGSGGGISTGYVKNYTYDDRLGLRQPPFFLNPIESSWRVSRQVEQTGR